MNEKLIILAVVSGVILNPLNTTMITVALPAIQNDFDLSATGVSWLIASYFTISAIFTPLIGKLSDRYGRKNIYLIGLVLVTISSILAPLSGNMPVLLTMRGIQAIGTSALYPAGIGIIRNTIRHRQNRVIGILSVFGTTTAAFGPTISGLLIELGGWPIIFYVNLPVVAIGAALAVFFIPKGEKNTEDNFKWDGIGIILFSLFITVLMMFLLSLKSGFQTGIFIVAVVLGGLFYVYEKRRDVPFIDVNFFRENLNVTLIYSQYMLTTLIFFTILLSMPTYLQSALGASSKMAGITMLSLSIFSMFTTPVVTRWMERAGSRIPLISSILIGLIGTVLLFSAKQSSPLYWIAIVLAVFGITYGVQNINLQNLLYSFIDKAESGIASGLLMTSRFVGNILASSIYGIAFSTGMNEANMGKMGVVLLIIVVVMFPGMFYVTRHDESRKTENRG